MQPTIGYPPRFVLKMAFLRMFNLHIAAFSRASLLFACQHTSYTRESTLYDYYICI
jgi:hypothetical protein